MGSGGIAIVMYEAARRAALRAVEALGVHGDARGCGIRGASIRSTTEHKKPRHFCRGLLQFPV
jgi:hypothetical protein